MNLSWVYFINSHHHLPAFIPILFGITSAGFYLPFTLLLVISLFTLFVTIYFIILSICLFFLPLLSYPWTPITYTFLTMFSSSFHEQLLWVDILLIIVVAIRLPSPYAFIHLWLCDFSQSCTSKKLHFLFFVFNSSHFFASRGRTVNRPLYFGQKHYAISWQCSILRWTAHLVDLWVTSI